MGYIGIAIRIHPSTIIYHTGEYFDVRGGLNIIRGRGLVKSCFAKGIGSLYLFVPESGAWRRLLIRWLDV